MGWDDKPYHSLDYKLEQQFEQRVYKLFLNGGMTCPNWDGTSGVGRCIFCSAGGSGDLTSPAMESATAQIEAAKAQVRRKMTGKSAYIAYSQSYANTYGSVPRPRFVSMEVICHPEVAALSITARPNCLGPEVVGLSEELTVIKPAWMGLNLQIIHRSTVQFTHRGYPLSVLKLAVDRLKEAGSTVIAHVILGLPGETREMMLDTVRCLVERITGADQTNPELAGIGPAVSGWSDAG